MAGRLSIASGNSRLAVPHHSSISAAAADAMCAASVSGELVAVMGWS
jgi:hypothetical protein